MKNTKLLLGITSCILGAGVSFSALADDEVQQKGPLLATVQDVKQLLRTKEQNEFASMVATGDFQGLCSKSGATHTNTNFCMVRIGGSDYMTVNLSSGRSTVDQTVYHCRFAYSKDQDSESTVTAALSVVVQDIYELYTLEQSGLSKQGYYDKAGKNVGGGIYGYACYRQIINNK